MELVDRIAVNIEKLDYSLSQIAELDKKNKFSKKEIEVIERAKSYAYDGKYYLKKEDYLTAFACIEYSHGLLDAIRLIYELI